jgi:RND family efflux transporter MFP subunit
MATTSREELTALKIERPDALFSGRDGPGKPPARRRGVVLRLLSFALWCIPLGLLAGAGAVGYRQYEQFRSPPAVTKGVVREEPLWHAVALLESNGYLKSRYQAMIGTKIPGRVERMYVEEGMKVKKGDTLAMLEHNDLKAMLASREAQTLRTAAELDEARADLWEKEHEERRVSRLLSHKSVTPEEYEKAVAGSKKAAARVAALEAGVKLMKANVEEIKATIVTMSLYAPFDGTVVEKQGEEGEVIATMAMSSSLGRTAVVTIANLEKMDVEADVHEELLSKIELGQPATVKVSAIPSTSYRARLRQIIPMGDRARKTVKVKVEILAPDEKLFPELESKVYFLPSSMAGISGDDRTFLFVDKAAVVEQDGRTFVWVIDQEKAVHKRPVVIAKTIQALSQIESGLKKGESVVIDPPANLREGGTVQ